MTRRNFRQLGSFSFIPHGDTFDRPDGPLDMILVSQLHRPLHDPGIYVTSPFSTFLRSIYQKSFASTRGPAYCNAGNTLSLSAALRENVQEAYATCYYVTSPQSHYFARLFCHLLVDSVAELFVSFRGGRFLPDDGDPGMWFPKAFANVWTDLPAISDPWRS